MTPFSKRQKRFYQVSGGRGSGIVVVIADHDYTTGVPTGVTVERASKGWEWTDGLVADHDYTTDLPDGVTAERASKGWEFV